MFQRLARTAQPVGFCASRPRASRGVQMAAAKRVLVPIGTGSEEMEAVSHAWSSQRCGHDSDRAAEAGRAASPPPLPAAGPVASPASRKPLPSRPAAGHYHRRAAPRRCRGVQVCMAGARPRLQPHAHAPPQADAPAAPPPHHSHFAAPNPTPLTQVTVASVEGDLAVTCARQTRILADRPIAECAGESWDLIALPVCGGPWGWGSRGGLGCRAWSVLGGVNRAHSLLTRHRWAPATPSGRHAGRGAPARLRRAHRPGGPAERGGQAARRHLRHARGRV